MRGLMELNQFSKADYTGLNLLLQIFFICLIMFKIIIGCYEQFVLGYKVSVKQTEDDGELSFEYEKQFSAHSHTGCIKCVASNNSYAMAGSTDETISFYDLRANIDLGPLTGHSGTINELAAPEEGGNRIISCGDDGVICIWQVGETTGLLKTLKGHGGPIQSIAVHPSGKLAMTACIKDGSIRTWNLIKGRICFTKKMKHSQIEYVRWSPSGKYYILASVRIIQVFDLESAKCVKEFETPQYVTTIKCLPLVHSVTNEEFLVIGDGRGYITIHTLPAGEIVTSFKAHDNRVKDVHPFFLNSLRQRSEEKVFLVTVSSDEKIKLWKFDETKLQQRNEGIAADCLLSINTSARITCVTVWQDCENKNETKKAVTGSATALQRTNTPDNNAKGVKKVKTNTAVAGSKNTLLGKKKRTKSIDTSMRKKTKSSVNSATPLKVDTETNERGRSRKKKVTISTKVKRV